MLFGSLVLCCLGVCAFVSYFVLFVCVFGLCVCFMLCVRVCVCLLS